MSAFSWLHFSDIHFRSNEKQSYIKARENLATFVKDKKLSCNYIFFTGDIVDKGQYDGAEKYINNLIDATNVCKDDKKREDCVFWVAGNHDISREENNIRTEIINKIRDDAKKSEPAYNAFESAFLDKEKRSYLINVGMEDYFSFSEQLGLKPFYKTDGKKNINQLIELQKLNIILLNTSLLSNDDYDEFKNLFIVDKTLSNIIEKIENPDDNKTLTKPTIILAHHGIEYLEKSEQTHLGDILKDNVDLYLCGHSHQAEYKHYPKGFLTNSFTTHEITCGGQTYKKNLMFMRGQFINGKVYIDTYTCDDNGVWYEDKNTKIKFYEENSDGFVIERFKPYLKRQGLPNDFKLFILGAPGVGKTTIANEVLGLYKGENLEVIEVDFIKDVLRENLDKVLKSIEDIGIKKDSDIGKLFQEKIGKNIMEQSSYKLDVNKSLEEQNKHIFDSLMIACDKREEKGVPTILEGVNLSIDLLYEKYKDTPANLPNMLFVNLYMDDEEQHKNRIIERNRSRKIIQKKADEYIDNFSNVRLIDRHYKNKCEEYKKVTGMNIKSINSHEKRTALDIAEEIREYIRKLYPNNYDYNDYDDSFLD